MLKNEYAIKFTLFIFFVCYIFFQESLSFHKMSDKLLSASLDKINAQEKNISIDYAVTGGSNALLGISSQQIAKKTALSSYNFAISAAEGVGVLNYQEWLKKTHASAKTIIYSSMNVWYLGKSAPFEMLPGKERTQHEKSSIISTPLIRAVSYAFKKSPVNINEYGDLTMVSCDAQIPFFEPAFADTSNIDPKRVMKFIETIERTQKSLASVEILIRIPPIYVAPDYVELFQNYLTFVHEILREKGMAVVGFDQAITTDPTKMCFGPNHPTPSAREEYTDALIQEITSSKQLVFQ
jgi:hypothetical protein